MNVPQVLAQLGDNMTPQIAAHWAFAVMALTAAGILPVAAFAVLRGLYDHYWMDQQVRLRVLTKIDNGEIEVDLTDD